MNVCGHEDEAEHALRRDAPAAPRRGVVGRGRVRTVYEAIDQSVSSVVALKETHTSTSEEILHAFKREAQLLANLRHPTLPKVTHYFAENGNQYLVMEYIAGDDLARLLNLRGQPFVPAQVMKWADELLGDWKGHPKSYPLCIGIFFERPFRLCGNYCRRSRALTTLACLCFADRYFTSTLLRQRVAFADLHS